jgi:uncharacterized membrane protein YqjE
MNETIVTVILLGGLGMVIAGFVFIGLMKLWFWMDDRERNDR